MTMKCILIAILFSLPFRGTTQLQKFEGTWQGTLDAGIKLRLVFHIGKDGKVTADSPDQSAYGLKCDNAIVSENEITIRITDVKAEYKGSLQNDTLINGIFTQGRNMPLQLLKKELVEERKRPQTPKPPFPYKSEDVIYGNKDSGISYGATLTIPEGTGPFPSLVLITGSGPQNRDEEILGHKLFAVLADHLTRQGFLVLRADDRGVGKSTGNFQKATSLDFANDINAHVDYLLSRPEVNKNKIGLIGHSEGGMIAPMVATARKDIAFIVLMAGPGVPCLDLLTEQNMAILRTTGIPEKTLKKFRGTFRGLADTIIKAPDINKAFSGGSALIEAWAAKTDTSMLGQLGLANISKRNTYVREIALQMYSPWFRYFLSFDPAPYLKKLSCPVLAINGGKDIQVIPGQNLPGIRRALKKSGTKKYTIKELPGMNHLFQTCQRCNIEEYGELEETISPLALTTISDWLLSITKKP